MADGESHSGKGNQRTTCREAAHHHWEMSHRNSISLPWGNESKELYLRYLHLARAALVELGGGKKSACLPIARHGFCGRRSGKVATVNKEYVFECFIDM